MDQRIGLNTGEGMATISGKKVKGKLVAFIIKTDGLIDIKIESEIGYMLMDVQRFTGVEYFALRVQGKDKMGHGTNYQNYEYHLDEPINIIITGTKKTDVEIIIRTK